MSVLTPVPMVRCRLVDDGEGGSPLDLRYVPAAEFELWRYYMETKHARAVAVEEVSVWVPEAPHVWDEHMDADALEPVVRVHFEKPGIDGVMVPVERFFPAETFPQAKAALLAHYDPRCRWTLDSRPGYFVSGTQSLTEDVTEAEEAAA